MIRSIVILAIMLIIIPYLSGLLFTDNKETVPATYVYGYMVNFAVFFVAAIYAILKDKSLQFLTVAYLVPAVIIALLGVFYGIFKKNLFRTVRNPGLSKAEMIYLSCFLGVVLFQLYKTVFYTYVDGDDAYYVALSQDMYSTGLLYRNNPYLGPYDGNLNYRYALAPFSAWISVLSKTANLQVTVVSFVIIPCVLIIITYILYGLIAKVLFDENREKRYVFMLLISVFVMFSNVSTSTAETFLLTRARQGKEGLSNIVIPFMFFLIANLIKKWHEENEEKKIDLNTFILILCGALSGGLMSVFGNILVLIMLFLFFVFIVLKEKRFWPAVQVAVLAISNMAMTLFYIIRG